VKEIVRRYDPAAEAAAWAKYRSGPASADDYDLVIDSDTVIRDDDGTPRVVYLRRDDIDSGGLADSLRDIEVGVSTRSGGLPTRSRQFGARPPIALRHYDHCTETTLRREHPDVFERLRLLGGVCAEEYRRWRPELFAAQMELVERIRPEWRMVGPFTSGIVNFESALPYHRDGGNYRYTWNVMATLRAGADGGMLVLPGLRLALVCADQTMSLFDAQGTTHGVTPIERTRRDGTRISVVYYCLKGLCSCGSPEEEIVHSRRKRTEREERRAGLIP
jgi:hypothetical protein